MKKLKIFAATVVPLLLTGLTLLPGNSERNEMEKLLPNVSSINFNNPYSVSFNVNYSEIGTMNASWYGPRFHGRLTANGEIYDQMGFTAAHKNLPFGTLLKLTNPKNNKSIVVRINDRGPYIPGRQIDLSKKAALELGTLNKGVVKIKVEEIDISGINKSIVN